jgi:hypothetical protein
MTDKHEKGNTASSSKRIITGWIDNSRRLRQNSLTRLTI